MLPAPRLPINPLSGVCCSGLLACICICHAPHALLAFVCHAVATLATFKCHLTGVDRLLSAGAWLPSLLNAEPSTLVQPFPTACHQARHPPGRRAEGDWRWLSVWAESCHPHSSIVPVGLSAALSGSDRWAALCVL